MSMGRSPASNGHAGPRKTARRPKSARKSARKPKRPYHHGQLRDDLVAAALEIIANDGIRALSVREAARRAGVSPAAPFRHFKDKRALIAAVAVDATRACLEHTERALARVGPDPMQRFRAIGVAYIDFALAEPARFRAMDEPQLAALKTDELNALRDLLAAALRREVAAAFAQGITHGFELEAVVLAGQALAHGLAHMLIDNRLGGALEDARAAAVAALDVLGPGIDPDHATRERAASGRATPPKP